MPNKSNEIHHNQANNMEACTWEIFDNVITDELFIVSESNEISLPVKNFNIKRNKNLELTIHTTCEGIATNRLITRPAGTVYKNTNSIELKSKNGIIATATGVTMTWWKDSIKKDGSIKRREQASIHEIECRLNLAQEKYVIEWLANIDFDSYILPDIIDDETEIIFKRTLCKNKNPLLITTKKRYGNFYRNCLNISIDGHEIYLGTTNNEIFAAKKPGFILYKESLPDSTKRKIRTCLSFAFGRPFIYLGYTAFDKDWNIVSIKALSAYHLNEKKVINRYSSPPSPLSNPSNGVSTNLIDRATISKLVNSLYVNYEKYNFEHISWLYWDSIFASTYSAPANWGATFEAIQKAFINAVGKTFNKLLIDPTSWKSVEKNILQSIEKLNVEKYISDILKNKIRNLNQAPQSEIAKRFLTCLGMNFSTLEKKSWLHRNQNAHGDEINNEEKWIELIRETKILKVLCHRVLIKLNNASDHYWDYYLPHTPLKKINESIG